MMSNEMMEDLPELFGLEQRVRKWRDGLAVLNIATAEFTAFGLHILPDL